MMPAPDVAHRPAASSAHSAPGSIVQVRVGSMRYRVGVVVPPVRPEPEGGVWVALYMRAHDLSGASPHSAEHLERACFGREEYLLRELLQDHNGRVVLSPDSSVLVPVPRLLTIHDLRVRHVTKLQAYALHLVLENNAAGRPFEMPADWTEVAERARLERALKELYNGFLAGGGWAFGPAEPDTRDWLERRAKQYETARWKRQREQLRGQAQRGELAAFAVAAGLPPTSPPDRIVEQIAKLRAQAQRAAKGATL